MNKLELLLAYCKDNSRVCPIPTRWNELYDLMLTGRHNFGARQGPRRPLILAAWSEPAELKALRLEEQLKWADNNNNLDPVDLFLRGLAESEWFHLVD
jgi:hypothetical protein